MILLLSIGLAETEQLGQFMLAQAKRQFPGRPIAVSIVGIDGAQVWGARMDGCKLASANFAFFKSLSAQGFSRETFAGFNNWILRDILAAQQSEPYFIPWGGGSPIEFEQRIGKFVIGAVGISGLDEEEDQALANQRPEDWDLLLEAAYQSA